MIKESDNMIKKVKLNIQRYNMINENDTVVLGLSGGADSICLFHILNILQSQLKFNLVAVHIHHGIRGIEADEDALFVQKLCHDNKIECGVFYYDIKKEAVKLKMTEEEAGRILRYKVFNDECEKYENAKISVAHHMNDQAETVLHNLFRGTGIKGLGGIRPVRDNVIRPLLDCTRKEIELYCKDNELDYKEDYTNKIDIYTRNKIRLKVIPYIEDNFNSNFISTLSQTSELFRIDNDYLEIETDKAFNACVTQVGDNYKIDIDLFQKQHKAIQNRVFRKIISKITNSLKDFTYVHVNSLNELINNKTGNKINLPKRITARKEYNCVIIGIINEGETDNKNFSYKVVNIPSNLYIKELGMEVSLQIFENKKTISYPKNDYTKWFDYDKIKHVIQIRGRKTGDYIELKGLAGTKKLKNYFVDQKIPRYERNNIPLVVDGQHIIWIVGYRISEKYKVTKETKNILQINIEETI